MQAMLLAGEQEMGGILTIFEQGPENKKQIELIIFRSSNLFIRWVFEYEEHTKLEAI